MVTRYGSKLASAWQKGFERFLKIRGQPREIALGLALGLFVGMSPFMGLHMAIAVFMAALFQWNKISAAIGVWISNPFTAPLIYPLTYLIGAKAMGIEKAYNLPSAMDWSWFVQMIQKAPEIISILTLGGIIAGLPLAVAGYLFSYITLNKYQAEIKRKLAERKAHRKEKRLKKRAEKKRKVRNIIRRKASPRKN